MEKFFIFFISLFLIGCTTKKPQTYTDLCPEVFFSKDHRVYITTNENSLTLNNISYKVEINNYNFVSECLVMDNKFTTTLSLLFIVKPDKAKKNNIVIPYYLALLDNQKNILNVQYYKVTGHLEEDSDNSSYIETEIIKTQDVIIPIQDINDDSITMLLIGFMLNQEKLKILN